MTFAQGAQSALTFVEESSFGVTPSAPTMVSLPYVSHSLRLQKQRLQSQEIRGDRQVRIDRHGNRNALGDIVVELKDTDYDTLLESAFFSAISSGTMKAGVTPKFMTIEDWASDISQARQFTGCAVDRMQMRIAPNSMITTTFSLVGSDMTQAGSRLDASPDAATGGEPFDAYSGAITEGGSTIGLVSSLDFTLTNSLNPTFVVGSDATPFLEYGNCLVEGTVEVYYQDAVLLNKFLNETESAMTVTLDDPTSGNSYTFTFPRIKYNGGDVPVSSPQSRLITMPFVALYDDTEATNIKLTVA